jgi:hypothetical protein
VSIAAVTNGIFKSMCRENLVESDTSRGRTSEYAGISSTSSNVRPSITTLSAIKDAIFLKIFIACKDTHIFETKKIFQAQSVDSKHRNRDTELFIVHLIIL